MFKDKDLHSITEHLQQSHDNFIKLVQPHRSSLWKYCMYVTKNAWDAEDLLQETLLKAFASLSIIKQPLHTKTFLFRIAINNWLDQCKKRRIPIDDSEIDKTADVQTVPFEEITDALETIIECLPPRQVSVLLLIDVFLFTAAETAEIIGTTEGAVYTLLHRARNTLKKPLKKNHPLSLPTPLSKEKEEIINRYMKAFTKSDFREIGNLLADHATNEVMGRGLDIGKVQIRKNSMGDWAQSGASQEMRAMLITLWGKHAIVYTKQTEHGPVLWDITTVQIEGEFIVKHKSYYFCKDFLLNAAHELNIELNQTKDLFGYLW